jgi:RHH-type transcriptional regulator, proline utilization regulon repressor / proline dehydrogenase / delta 1-pyrroline-5-carboxylate dehydrogenase
VLELAGGRRDFEFQKLHGMGDALYGVLRESGPKDLAVRVYAPVGRHRDLLPYLVRRLLENGASASFIHQIADPAIPVEDIVVSPDALLLRPEPNPLSRPPELYPDRRNALGFDLADHRVFERISLHARSYKLPPEPPAGKASALLAPARIWDAPVGERAAVLERAAGMLEARHLDFIALAIREGGKTIPDAVSELREAVDYCRYYALQARALFAEPARLPGPTGERNILAWAPRGIFACIAPWNFPLAIFLGQVTAALAAGNGVIAKPAEQTPRIAAEAVALLHHAGVPREALQLGVGEGGKLGAALVADRRISGVAFTGSTETARAINRALAERSGPIVPLIAETGGINPMLVDSSALPEQVVADVLASAFQSAGQRCSALRVLFLQDEAADRMLPMLAGAMAELAVGDPADPATDVGPAIDAETKAALTAAAADLRTRGRVIAEAPAPSQAGNFVAPLAVEVGLGEMPKHEVFGPVLPVIRYDAERLDDVLAAINRTGYGLTLGIHSRIDRFARTIMERVGVGNIYLNRSMIGAVVGVQPFGGHGLSGTGPKAGGPHYLQRFAREVTTSVNTAAIGGDVQLVARPKARE